MNKIRYIETFIILLFIIAIGFGIGLSINQLVYGQSISCEFLKVNHYGKYIVSDGEIRWDYYNIAIACGGGINMWAGTYS